MDGNYYWTIAVIIWTQIRLILKITQTFKYNITNIFPLKKKKTIFLIQLQVGPQPENII